MRNVAGGNLQQVKQLLSPRVLRVPGVSGIGTPRGELTVYLENDSAKLKEEIMDVVKSVAPGQPCKFVVTGKFVKQH